MIIQQWLNVISCFKHFTHVLLAASVNPTEANDGSEVDDVVFEENVSETTASLQKKRKAMANAALLTAFNKLLKCDKIEDLFDDILKVNVAIDR